MARTKAIKERAPTARMAHYDLRPKQAIYYGTSKPKAGTVSTAEDIAGSSDVGGRKSDKAEEEQQLQETPKRRRGRPKKEPQVGEAKKATALEDIKSISGNNATPKRGRGRPR